MTLRAHLEGPCWEIVDPETLRPPAEQYGEGWTHYATREAAEHDLADESDRWGGRPLTVRQSFDKPCLGLFCDGGTCAAANDPCDLSDEGWTHLDPGEPLAIPLTDMDWMEIDGKHYCPDCTPPWCDDCGEQHYCDCPETPPAPRPVPICDGQLSIEDALATAPEQVR